MSKYARSEIKKFPFQFESTHVIHKVFLPQFAKANTGLYSQMFKLLHLPDKLPSPHSSPIVRQTVIKDVSF